MLNHTYLKSKYNIKRHQKNLKLINAFYQYYQHASYSDTCKKFHVSKTCGGAILRQIKTDKTNSSIKGSSDRKLTIKEKVQTIKYLSTHDINQTWRKFNLRKRDVLRWVSLYKTGHIDWEPNENIWRICSKREQKIIRNTTLTLALTKDLVLKAFKVEEGLFGKLDWWTKTKIRYRAIMEVSKLTSMPVDVLCVLGCVSKAGYYNWLNQGQKQFHKWDRDIIKKIKWIRKHYPDNFGCRMISFYLKQKFNLNLGHKVVLRYLNNLNLHTRRINLRDYDDEYRKEHLMPKIKNLLLDENGKPDFSVKHKNEKWVSDLSMIHKDKNGVKTYIYVIMDLYGRYIIDFDFAEFKNNKPMVLKVIERCLKKEKPLISHSDGGLEVRNWDCYHMYELAGVKQSFSQKAKPTQNSCCESFFSQYKYSVNWKIISKHKTAKEMIELTKKWIYFYNHKPHTTLNYQTPHEFRNGTE